MQTRHEYSGITWIDLESPTPEEVRRIVEEFQIEAMIAEELIMPSTKARAEFYPRYAYVVMHFPALKHTHKQHEQEVDFIIGKNFLITTHYDTIDPLHKLSKVFDVNAVLDSEPLGEHAGFLFFYTVRKLYRSIEHELDYIKRDLSEIDEHIFTGHEVEMVSVLSRAARALLNLRQTIEPHREIWHTLEEQGPAFFGEPFTPYLRALSNEYYRVHNHIMRQTETLHELRETNDSLLSTKQNETMKVLTVIAFITLPLSFIAGLFQMNTSELPPLTFWEVIGIMILVALSMILVIRHKKWL